MMVRVVRTVRQFPTQHRMMAKYLLYIGMYARGESIGNTLTILTASLIKFIVFLVPMPPFSSRPGTGEWAVLFSLRVNFGWRGDAVVGGVFTDFERISLPPARPQHMKTSAI